jgi:hypothetical protein
VFFGGPVQVDHGFVLHRPVGEWKSTLPVGDMGLTTSRGHPRGDGARRGPARAAGGAGLRGLGAGQLEDELAHNGWLTVPADGDLIFNVPPEARYAAAMNALGVNAANLSEEAGHAWTTSPGAAPCSASTSARSASALQWERPPPHREPAHGDRGRGQRAPLRRDRQAGGRVEAGGIRGGHPQARGRQRARGVAKLAEKFARRLEARYGVPVTFVDETLTSATAESQLRETRTRAAQKGDVDALAAAIILQSCLDSRPRP